MTKCRLVIKMRPRAWCKFGLVGGLFAAAMKSAGAPVSWLFAVTLEEDVAS
jgi:hypothetical protein